MPHPIQEQLKNKLAWLWVSPMALAALFLLFFFLPLILRSLNRLELTSFENRQLTIQQERGAKSGIVLVEIDKTTLNTAEIRSLFGRYPFRREIYGAMLRFFQRTTPKAIMMEMTFSGGEDLDHPESDDNLVASIPQNIPTLSSLTEAQKTEVTPFESPSEREALFDSLDREWLKIKGPPIIDVRYYDAYQIPLAKLLRTAIRIYPLDNLVYDDNGRVRQFVMFGRGKIKGVLPTLPVASLLLENPRLQSVPDGTLILGKRQLHLRGESSPIIRWYGNVMEQPVHSKTQVYPRISLGHLVKSQLWWECKNKERTWSSEKACAKVDFTDFNPLSPDIFKDHYVMVGYSSDWYDSNRHATLYDNRRNNNIKYPNLYIQANILDNLLNDDFVGRPGWRIHLPFFERTFPELESISLITVLTVFLMFATTLWFTNRWNSVLIGFGFIMLMATGYSYITVEAYQHFNLWLNWVYPMVTLILTFMGSYLYRYSMSEKRKQHLRMTFAKYISPVAMEYIEKNPEKIKLGGQRRELTFLFCDIRGFTAYAEQHSADVVQEVLTRYFSAMHSIIQNQYGGVMDKLMGDAIMAYWGFPLEAPDDHYRAVSAALTMKATMDRWAEDPMNPPFKIGIGINTGEAMIGNVGSVDFMDFTVIGDSVNTASRLEKLNKRYGTSIIISRKTYECIKDRIHCRYLGQIRIRGKEQETELFEPLGYLSDPKYLPENLIPQTEVE